MESPASKAPTAGAPLADRTASELAERIAAGDVSSVEAVEACIARIAATAGEINALSQPLFESARRIAEQADAARASGRALGPLHGVPVTIKDCFAVQGAEATLGIPGYSRGPADEDSPLVARLRAAGAVVLGKTNVPQAMLMHECSNPVFGRTRLPGFPDRSPGGSTGGEAALVAAGGSPLGLGSDLGGSTRQPAAACGVCGFKPSAGRLTVVGSERAISRGMQAIAIQPGPIARSVADLDLAMQVLGDHTAVDRRVDETPLPWPDYRAVDVAGLLVAVWAGDGVFPPAGALCRAIQESAFALQAAGATTLKVRPPAIESMFRIYLGLISADGMLAVRRLTRGGKVDPQLARQLRLAAAPRWLRNALSPLLSLVGQRELSELLRWTGARSAEGYWRLTLEADEYRRRFWRDLEEQAGGPVDAVLSPPYGLPALRHGTALHLLRAASHTFLANLLGAPAGVVPWGRVTDEDERGELEFRRRGWSIQQYYARQNARGSAGLPLAVEVMAPAGRDDVALAVMAAIEAAGEAPNRPTA